VAEPLDPEIDRLYGLPLEQFTPERDALAKRLRGDGDRDAATAVKKLRKPTVAAWALNQAKRHEPKRVAELIDAGAQLREAQQQLVAGGERGLLRDASAQERRAAERVVALGEQQLAAAGHAANASAQSKLWSTVRAAAVNLEASELLKAGRLTRDYEVSDLGLGDAIPASAAKKQPPQPKKPAADAAADRAADRRAQKIRRQLDRARAQHDTAKDRAAQAHTRVRDARKEAARAASALERAEASAKQADDRVQAARSRVAELEDELRAVGE
jgi:hypothetical protein